MSMLFFLILNLFSMTLGFHENLNERELRHIFGTRSKRSVPDYSIAQPKWLSDNGNHFLEINFNQNLERFRLENYEDRLFSESFHLTIRDEKGDLRNEAFPEKNCVFRGKSEITNGTEIAIVGCDDNLRGLITTSDGSHYLIHPVPRSPSGDHVIHKRSASIEETEHECLFKKDQDPHPEDQQGHCHFGGNSSRLAVSKLDELTIELAVFADDAMWRHFVKLYGAKARIEMHRFIMAAVNNIDVLYARRSLQPRINIRVVRYEVMERAPRIMSRRVHKVGDVDKLLEAFCSYQNLINPSDDRDSRHWDHALLFSGYDLYRDGLRTVAGYAPVKGMCNGKRSCTLNEGLDFGSIFVVTHEMGHSLGMYHDGDNECDLRCCIMSPSIGSGKTDWSHCSNKEFNVFLSKLGTKGRPPHCLLDNHRRSRAAFTLGENNYHPRDYPGQQFVLDEQCAIFHGECWKHELKDGQIMEDICDMVWCGNGEGIVRTAHPAMEGTYCGPGMWCMSGKCRPHRYPLKSINGNWSQWDQNSKKNCASGCGVCEIEDQLRLSRSTRSCTNPSPNNGGDHCDGDDTKGIICQQMKCEGLSIGEFASKVCKSIRDDPNVPNPQLSGIGLQYQQATCKIWCHIEDSDQIRTVGNFPDGTPCGENEYCIKGLCRPLICDGTVIGSSDSPCPVKIIHSFANRSHKAILRPEPMLNHQPVSLVDNESKDRIEVGSSKWSEWSFWSECYSIECGKSGFQLRSRKCLLGNCPGSRKQRRRCMFYCGQRDRKTETFVKKPKIPAIILANYRTTTPKIESTAPKAVYPPNFLKRNHYKEDSNPVSRKRFIVETSYEKNSDLLDKDQQRVLLEKTGYRPDQIDASVDQNTVVFPSRNKKQEPLSGSFARYLPTTAGYDHLRLHPHPNQQMTQLYQNIGWSLWSEWSICSDPCLTGSRYRRRDCLDHNLCRGPTYETRQCNQEICYWQNIRYPRQNPPSFQYYPQAQANYYPPQVQQRYYDSQSYNNYPGYYYAQG